MAQLDENGFYQLPKVTQFQLDNMSWWEPPIPKEDDLDQVIWLAAIVKAKTGLPLKMARGTMKISGVDIPSVCILLGNRSTTKDLTTAWTYLNGIEDGAQAMRQQYLSAKTPQEDIEDEADNPHYFH